MPPEKDTPARVYLPLKDADRREQGTEEDFGVRMAVNVDQWHPGTRLLCHFLQRIVLQKVGKHHFVVSDVLLKKKIRSESLMVP